MEKKIIPGKPERRWTLESRNPSGPVSFPSAGAGAASNYVDRRTRRDRRIVYDRRELIRFEGDRRASAERRLDADPWAFP